MSALSDRDANLKLSSRPAIDQKQVVQKSENMPKKTELRRTLFEQRSEENHGKSSQAYVSPSDAIMSPASQKLAGFKQRQINKQGSKNATSRVLFARTPSTVSTGFDDIGTVDEK